MTETRLENVKRLLQSLQRYRSLKWVLAWLLVVALGYWLLPVAVDGALQRGLQQAGYSDIRFAPTQWSSNGTGFVIRDLHAGGGSLPGVDIVNSDIWLDLPPLLDGNIVLRQEGELLGGATRVALHYQIASGNTAFELRIDEVKIADIIHRLKALKDLQLTGEDIDGRLWIHVNGQLPADQTSAIPVDINVSLRNVTRQTGRLKQSIASMNGRMDVKATPNGEKWDIRIDDASGDLNGLALQRSGMAEIMKVNTLSWSGIKALMEPKDAASVQIDAVTMDGFLMRATLATDGSLPGWQDLQQSGQAKREAGSTAVKSESEPGGEPGGEPESRAKAQTDMVVQIRNVHLANGKFELTDAGIQPPVSRDIGIETIDINQIRIGKPLSDESKQAASLSGKGSMGDLGRWQVKGAFLPDDPIRDSGIEFTLKGIDVAPYSPYVIQRFGKSIQSGNIDLKGKVRIAEGSIKATGDVFARKVKLVSPAGNVAGTIKDTVFPLDSALDVLRDGNDNISLTLEAEGKLGDPAFKVGKIWDKVLIAATRQAAMSLIAQALQPYGALLTVGQFLYDQSRKIQLQPVYFLPGGDRTVGDPAEYAGYSEKIAQLLKQKQHLTLEICPRHLPAEAQQAQAMADARKKPLISMLLQQGVQSERILSCQPTVDEAGKAKPRLELRLM